MLYEVITLDSDADGNFFYNSLTADAGTVEHGRVITSYSIHYTKLYETPTFRNLPSPPYPHSA